LSFSIIDIVFVGLIGLFMIRCYLKGFVSEILSMAAVVLGLLAALFLHKSGAEYLKNQFWHDTNITLLKVAAFAILFIFVFIVVKIVEKMLINIIDAVSLTNADCYLGIIFGLAEGLAVVSLIILLLRIQPLFDSTAMLNDSIFARYLLPLITGKEKVSSV
jgi:membrane protein required for colicin V production